MMSHFLHMDLHCLSMYEGCSNMNASSFIAFVTNMLQQNAIPFWKELFVTFKMTPNIKNNHYISRVSAFTNNPLSFNDL